MNRRKFISIAPLLGVFPGWVGAQTIGARDHTTLNMPNTSTEKVWARVWEGRTRASLFEEYSVYLYDEGVRKIAAIPGNLGVQMFRRLAGQIGEFSVTSYWPDLQTIKGFAGNDIELAHPLAKDPVYLLDVPMYVKHFEVFAQSVRNLPASRFTTPR